MSVPESPYNVTSLPASAGGLPRPVESLIEYDDQVWRLRDGNVQGEFALVNGIGERLRLVGVPRAAQLFGLAETDIQNWIAAGRITSVTVNRVEMVRVHLSETGHLTLLS